MSKCIKCGSYAFNLYKEDIDQGGLCDVHYWQGRAHRAEALAEQPAQQEPVTNEGFGACPISRTIDLEIKPNDRRTEKCHQNFGDENQRHHLARRGVEVHTSGAEFGAYTRNFPQHEGVISLPGHIAPAMIAVRDWLQGDCDIHDIPRFEIASLVAFAASPQAQPAREFVGLTDEEIEQGCKESWVTEQAWQSAVWWAEEKLKEKNNA